MYFPDLSAYGYWPTRHSGIKNVGWLSSHYPYIQGHVPVAFIEQLWVYCVDYCFQVTRGSHPCPFCDESYPIRMTRHHRQAYLCWCSHLLTEMLKLCSGEGSGEEQRSSPEPPPVAGGDSCRHQHRGLESPMTTNDCILGSAEIWVLTQHDEIYAAPNLMYHFSGGIITTVIACQY